MSNVCMTSLRRVKYFTPCKRVSACHVSWIGRMIRWLIDLFRAKILSKFYQSQVANSKTCSLQCRQIIKVLCTFEVMFKWHISSWTQRILSFFLQQNLHCIWQSSLFFLLFLVIKNNIVKGTRRCDWGVLNYTNCLVLGFTRHKCNSTV